MKPDEKSEHVAEFCKSVVELRYRLRRMFQVKLKEAGISISFEVLEVMGILYREDGVNQQELADLLFKDKSSMTYLIDNMVRAGWVLRKEDDSDRRNKLIFLTDEARQLKNTLKPMATECYSLIGEGINDDDIKASLQMLSKMNNSLSDFIE